MHKLSDSGAWQRSEGKNPEGGLNAKGRASLKAQGHDIKPGVKGKADTPEKQRRKGSFLSRMFGPGAPGSMKQDNGEPSRRALSAAAWGEPVPRDDAGRARLYAKGQALLARYKNTKKGAEELEYERKARAYADKYHAALLARLKAEHEDKMLKQADLSKLSPEALGKLRHAYQTQGFSSGGRRGALLGALLGYGLADDDDKVRGVLAGTGAGFLTGGLAGGLHGSYLTRDSSPGVLFKRTHKEAPSYNRIEYNLRRPGTFTGEEIVSSSFGPGDYIHKLLDTGKGPPPFENVVRGSDGVFHVSEPQSDFAKKVLPLLKTSSKTAAARRVLATYGLR